MPFCLFFIRRQSPEILRDGPIAWKLGKPWLDTNGVEAIGLRAKGPSRGALKALDVRCGRFHGRFAPSYTSLGKKQDVDMHKCTYVRMYARMCTQTYTYMHVTIFGRTRPTVGL